MLDEFFQIVCNLKKVQRQGWKNKLNIQNPESVADHCYSMTTMAMVLADLQNLDTLKILKMSLIHDLAESITGDHTPQDITQEKKRKLENKTMKDILQKLPSNLYDEYLEIWHEFQYKQTKEAVLVHEIDRLEMAFQAKNYFGNGAKYSKERIQSFLNTADKEIADKMLREILTKLQQ